MSRRPSNLTVGDVAETFGVAPWRVRRVVDSLHLPVERAGRYRLIQRSALGEIAVELRRRGWLPKRESQEATA
jgi:hypothetical protein